MDFMKVSVKSTRNGVEIYPKFIIKKSSDMMIRGGDFYAIWLPDKNRWSTNEEDALRLIDQELSAFASDSICAIYLSYQNHYPTYTLYERRLRF